MAKATVLRDEHVRLGGKMVDFAGWEMPVEFEGLRKEHERVRSKVGLFDVSHMGEIRVRGEKALETLEWLTTNSVENLEKGMAQYSLLSNEKGGIVDDIIVYCVEKGGDYLVCVNAANKDKDFQWMLKQNKGADITDESDQWSQIAVQGPNAIELLTRVFDNSLSSVKPFHFVGKYFSGSECWVAFTGYTGEKGAEIFVPNDKAVALWQTLLEKGGDLGVAPIGLGARDTLRTEMKYSLYGNEINDETTPFEAGLGWVVKADKKDFIGKGPMLESKVKGVTQKLIGFKMLERGIPRHGYKVFSFDNAEIGEVTSGTMSPSMGESIGIAYVQKDFANEGTEFNIQVRQKMIRAKVVKTPFYQP